MNKQRRIVNNILAYFKCLIANKATLFGIVCIIVGVIVHSFPASMILILIGLETYFIICNAGFPTFLSYMRAKSFLTDRESFAKKDRYNRIYRIHYCNDVGARLAEDECSGKYNRLRFLYII